MAHLKQGSPTTPGPAMPCVSLASPVNRATEAEWEAMLGACRSWRDRFLVALLWFTGRRVGEALGLRRCDGHLADHLSDLGCLVAGAHLHVVHRDNINRSSAKSRNDRHAPANRWVVAYYSRYLAEREACRGQRPATSSS